jgi:tetratricopeptide (TPR) repeat protein
VHGGVDVTKGAHTAAAPGAKNLARRYRELWSGFGVSRVKLTWFRVVFFTLIGLDGFLQISHAPRYGAGDFNVAHIPGLDAILPGPSRSGILLVFLLQSYLGFRVAWGRAGRIALPLLALLYGYGYFISQLDSYQHHYLVFLLLFLCCFVPWPQPGSDQGAPAGTITSWALRLIFVQISIVYFWAAVAKLDPVWLDGTTIGRQIQPGAMRDAAEALGLGVTAKLVIATELFLAVALFIRALWLPALVVGVGLHAAIELSGFEIGIFSYYMVAFYLLLVPDRVMTLAMATMRRALQPARAALRAVWHARWHASWRALAARPALSWTVFALLVAIGLGAWLLLPFGEAVAAAAVSAALVGLAVLPAGQADRRARAVAVGFGHAVACAAILTLHLATDQAHDYYKFWGGTSRRLGHWDEARTAYQTITRISPDWGPGHYHLAGIARRDGRVDEALAGYERAQQVSPDDYRAFLAAAEMHHEARRGAEALAAVRRALALEPGNPRDVERAQAIYKMWSQAAAQPGRPTP